LGLLDRAKKMLQGRSSPVPARSQYYRVACGEGHVLHGQRTEGYQALRCPNCGDGIFVLPRSPLPDPVAPASAGTKARSTKAVAAGDELVLTDPPPQSEIAQARAELSSQDAAEGEANIEWVDEGAEVVPPVATSYSPEVSIPSAPNEPKVRPVRPHRPSAPNEPNSPTPRRNGPSAPNEPNARAPRRNEPNSVPAGMVRVDEPPSLKEWAWERRNPLIFLGVGLIVVATVAIRFRQKRLDELPRVAEIGRVEGLTQLDLGEFLVAKKLLGDAAAAVDALGGQVEGADAIRQGAREAAIFADRVDEELEEIVQKRAKYPDADWPSHFSAIYKGQSILVEAQVVDVPDPSRPGSDYEIDYQILWGRTSTPTVKGRIDLTGFRLFEQAKPKVGDNVIFGARLASIELDTKRGEFMVGLAPDSGVFITHDRALARLEWYSSEATEEDR
jgi:DNA-directed RNA polymerase subunit RPC12/RpoP